MSFHLWLILNHKYSVYKYRLSYTQCRPTYGVFPSVYTTYIKVVFTILNVVIHTAYSHPCIWRFIKVVFTIHNVVIHTAYSKLSYLCSFSLLLYLLPMSLCGWSSMPAVSSSAQSVIFPHVLIYPHHVNYKQSSMVRNSYLISRSWMLIFY